nr:MAG TPA: hypothetical protein [Caudoviricetes sp.]
MDSGDAYGTKVMVRIRRAWRPCDMQINLV